MNAQNNRSANHLNQATATHDRQADSPKHYQGFSLRQVTWGYRDTFAKTIESLFKDGSLGPDRQAVTARFFDLLKRSDQYGFGHVQHQFLAALTPQNRWIMNLPGIFSDLVDLGGSLAERKLFYGTRFFETLAKGGLGHSPQDVQTCLTLTRRLTKTDDDLAIAFLSGYETLSARLSPHELERYIDVGLKIYQANHNAGCSFLRGELKTSESYILAITQECRLADIANHLSAMIKALSGDDCEVVDLGHVDSDDLFDRGSQLLTVSGHLYLPVRIRRFDCAWRNRQWYLLCAIVSAAMFLNDAFPRIHGHPQYRTCDSLTGHDRLHLNLFQIVEFVRVLRDAGRRWPGVRRLIDFAVQTELADAPETDKPIRLFADAMNEACQSPLLSEFRTMADNCVNCIDTADRIKGSLAAKLLAHYPSLRIHSLQPMSFLPDFRFPMDFEKPPSDQMIADLKHAARERQSGENTSTPERMTEGSVDGKGAPKTENGDGISMQAAYVYDEWDVHQNDYRPAWCQVHQQTVEPADAVTPEAKWMDSVRKVSAVFERLKPDVARREKHLEDGDSINTDLLVEHVVNRRHDPSPPVRFYEQPIINHRDLAVLILLDVSGSTGGQLDTQTKVLDIEKQASVILGQGLSVLGDRFAICGFSSRGREQCEYLIFKDFEADWNNDRIGQIMAASPRHSTRMGPAIRHAGYLLSRQPHRQRLIILVTDGKPMDQDYDATTRYAQHDVRMACEEIARQDIHTFAISTEENTVADMEIMFPHRRFAILPNMRRLPDILPRLYIRMTVR